MKTNCRAIWAAIQVWLEKNRKEKKKKKKMTCEWFVCMKRKVSKISGYLEGNAANC